MLWYSNNSILKWTIKIKIDEKVYSSETDIIGLLNGLVIIVVVYT